MIDDDPKVLIPDPVNDIVRNRHYDRELSLHDLIHILWFISWTTDFNITSYKKYSIHVNHVRQATKAMCVTKLDMVDTSCMRDIKQTIDRFDRAFKLTRKQRADLLNSTLVSLEKNLKGDSVTSSSPIVDNDQQLQVQSGFEIPDGYICHKLNLTNTFNQYFETLTFDAVTRLLAFAIIIGFTYVKYCELMNLQPRLRPQSGCEDVDVDDSKQLAAEFVNSSSIISKSMWSLTFVAIGATSAGLVNPLVGLALAKQCGSVAFVSSGFDVLNHTARQLVFNNVKCKAQSGNEADMNLAEPAPETNPNAQSNPKGKNEQMEKVFGADAAFFKLTDNTPTRQVENKVNVDSINQQFKLTSSMKLQDNKGKSN